jgi:hypothetical protein
MVKVSTAAEGSANAGVATTNADDGEA